MSKYKVHNLREGSRPGNWLDFWKTETDKELNCCRVVGCTSKATDGAHVQLDATTNRKWYIVPMCHRHNCQHGAHYTVYGPLVPINGVAILW